MTLEQLQAGVVLPIDKPRQWTSFQVVNKIKAILRKHYNVKKIKIGHAGTLDPLATGLLLVCIGKSTKSIPLLQSHDKTYTGTMVLGATTPCYDLEQPIDQYYPYRHITPDLIRQTIPQFVGEIQQTPPLFSAVKVNGQRAYQYARNNAQASILQPKNVSIHQFDMTDFSMGDENASEITAINAEPPQRSTHLYNAPQGVVPQRLPRLDFRIVCSKGTYIRSLARDLGEALGSGAFLSALRREQIGQYSVENALQIEQLEAYITHQDEM